MFFTVTSTTETGEIRRSKIRASNAEFAYEDACYSLGPNESILSIICDDDNDSMKNHRNELHENERRAKKCLECNNQNCRRKKSK